jgi:Golgi phosphoprotein 3
MQLTFIEELLLLSLDDETGVLRPALAPWLDTAEAGALLMDLALRNRVDTDPDKLVVVDKTPTGEPLLDQSLAIISEIPSGQAIDAYVAALARHGERFREAALERLCERGILKRKDDRLLWVFKTRTYPVIDGKAEREVKLRIFSILFDDEIPDPRDVVLISLVSACNLLPVLLSPEECEHVRDRVELLRKMDLIGQSVGRAIRDIEWSIALTQTGF